LIRVCVILGELASQDPGGNWTNRPANSLVSILLPWHPQTIAPIEKRKVAVQTLYREFPEVAWQLLIDLLPSQHKTTTGTYKPIWRNTILKKWNSDITQEDYWEQISIYSQILISIAQDNITKLILLIDHLDDLPRNAFDQVLELLSRENILELSEEEKFPIWNRLMKLTQRHRKYSDAKWALQDELILRIEAITEKLTPAHPVKLYQRLFTENDFDLYEERDNFEEQDIRLDECRQEAVKKILNFDGLDSVIQFVEEVESSIKVGLLLGKIANEEIDKTLIPRYLDSANNKFKNFISGYIWSRHHINGWSWADGLEKSSWKSEQIVCFLNFLPFVKDTWIRAISWLENLESEYWRKVEINPHQAREDLDIAVEKLLDYERPYAAIYCLDVMRHLKHKLNIMQCIKALNLALSSSEPSYLISTYRIINLIEILQDSSEVLESDLMNIEWAYLKVLDKYSTGRPKLLETYLSTNPEFFCQMIQLLYRSKKKDDVTEPDNHLKVLAENAWQLLHNWCMIPGTQEDGSFDSKFFLSWLQRVKEICIESGHLEVAFSKIGEVLIYSPTDPDGLWIHHYVLQELNARDAEDMRRGFSIGIVNSRGVHFVDPSAKPERELVEEYRQKAEAVENAGYQRFAVTLRQLSDRYEKEANRIIREYSIDISQD